MTPEELEEFHSDMVGRLAKDPEAILNELTPQDCDCLHAVIGICGEAGELLDAIKKVTIYRKPIDLENVIEELGDIEFYMELLRASLGITRLETIRANIDKLNKRYGESYSDQAAQDRADKT